MKEKIISEMGLSFEDVLIAPRRSDIRSRYGNQINTSARVARGAPEINIPIISANMDTVTEAEMAIEMAVNGGLGIIHRLKTPQRQAEHVRLVKEKMRTIEEFPPMLPETATVKDALEFLEKRKRGYVVVYKGESFNGSFSGIATDRNLDAAEDKKDLPLKMIMVPRKKVLTVPKGTSQIEAVSFMREHMIEKVPVVDKKGLLVGVYTRKDYTYRRDHPNAALDNKGRLMVGAAIGVHEQDIERAHLLVEAGVDILVIDIAHGALDYIQEMLHRLKVIEKIPVPIIAGNVADGNNSGENVKYVRDSGADAVKIGVGPGLQCETRNVAGVGVPQVTAIINAFEALANDSDPIPIIADGGIREPGDVSKAIVSGASTVMIGTLFAGTDKSPGELERRNGTLGKTVRGMASKDAAEKRRELGDPTTELEESTPEGRTTFTPYRGTTENVISELMGGLRSGMSYVGAHTPGEMEEKGQLIVVSPAGASEQTRPLK